MVQKPISLSQAIDGYFVAASARRLSPHTLADYDNTFRKLEAWLDKDPPLASITPAQIRAFLSSLTHLSAKTILNYHVGPEPDRNGPRRLEVIKTNLVRYPEALGVVFEEGDGSAPVLRYGDAPQAYREPTQAELCAGWLVDVLEEAEEPLKPKEVVALAADFGFPRATVYRARKELGEAVVEVGQGKRDPNKRWVLAGKE